jgi:hypothetical protein
MQKLKQCPNRGVPYLIGDANNTGKRIITKARCKQWDCPYCAEINRYEHYNRVANGIARWEKQNVEMQFVTITCHEKWRGYGNSIKNWRANKDKLLARVRRYHKKMSNSTCDYVYIPECHQDGTIHVHGLFQGDFGTRWWKDNARESGLGYMAESARVNTALQAINYVLKYITKEMGKPNVSKGFRRINYSRGFPDREKGTSDYDWSLLERDQTIESAIIEGVTSGKRVIFSDTEFVTLDDLLDNS